MATRLALVVAVFQFLTWAIAGEGVPALPGNARLVLSENWDGGKIDPQKWYVLRKKWGGGNHGVVPENVRIERDSVNGVEQNVLVCEAHGDRYDGPVAGLWGKKERVGGVIVSKAFFASGRFDVVMKVGSTAAHDGGPADPAKPIGTIPAIWTYAYRFVHVSKEKITEFIPEKPLYNPHIPAYGIGANEYWSELDFPELGKKGDFSHGLYNTFLQNRHDPRVFNVGNAADGDYHTYTTEWRTKLEPLEGISDVQVIEHEGFFWIKDKAVKFERYLGNPLKRLDKDKYALYAGEKASHWIDGKFIGENTKWVPAMAAQLNLGVWLPDWAGAAPWKTATVSFGTVKVWQFDDPGDVRGVLTEDLKNNMDKDGREVK